MFLGAWGHLSAHLHKAEVDSFLGEEDVQLLLGHFVLPLALLPPLMKVVNLVRVKVKRKNRVVVVVVVAVVVYVFVGSVGDGDSLLHLLTH